MTDIKFKTGVIKFFSIIEGMAYIEELESRGYTPEGNEPIVMAPESGSLFFTRGGKYYVRSLKASSKVKESNFYEFKWVMPKSSFFTPSSKKKIVLFFKLNGYIGQLKLLKLKDFGIEGIDIEKNKFNKGVLISRGKDVTFIPDEESVQELEDNKSYEIVSPEFLLSLTNALL